MTNRRQASAALLGAALLMFAAPGRAATMPSVQPLQPQPAAAAIQPGLVPTYYRNITFEHVDDLVRFAGRNKGEVGKPVAPVDGGDGSGAIWESQMTQLWGLRLDGMIRLERGDYYFAANSNDGVRIFLGGPMLLEDPDVHGDRMSSPAEVKVTVPGWYPLTIWYFQKKNTATLQFFWQKPGAAKFEIVPAAALGHL
ncbi:MAG TPA: PA14 domain-containing protein [Ferrovibrio sp.]|jgi:hypothetical protein|uniref:PA14 domain-containing protein n=1 Tax=Ferrovibrio sp. TaxID=1917215 RepID=UPI002ED140C7